MSWSVSFIGVSSAIASALDIQSEKMATRTPSKQEFDGALPYIKGILALNTGSQSLKLTASGSDYGGHSSCYVNIEYEGSELV